SPQLYPLSLHDALPIYVKFIERRPKFWAGGFLFDAQARKVLLHLRDEQTPFNPIRWAFFGGLNEGNESFGECFIRELHEEIGLRSEEHTSELQSPDHLV